MNGNGEELLFSRRKALYWYEKAAEQGDAQSQFCCGNMYFRGEGTEWGEPVFDKAFYWYEKAADQGNPQAEFALGNMYANGNGTEVNEKRRFLGMRNQPSMVMTKRNT